MSPFLGGKLSSKADMLSDRHKHMVLQYKKILRFDTFI